jgi:ATP-dependent DNA helicase 2 subunit 1
VRHAHPCLSQTPKAHTPPSNRLDALQERVRQRTHKKRRLTSLELYISPANPVGLPGSVEGAPVRMAVGLYSLVMQATKPTPERVDKLENRPLKTTSSFMARGFPIAFNPREPATRQTRRLPYGGGTLEFSPQEAADLRAGPGQPGLALLGFKPLASLRDDDQLRSSWFLHPEEAQRPGSTVAFTALLAAMLRARVAAICLLTRSSKTPPRLVALLPQAPEVEMRPQAGGGEAAVMTAQPGMHVLCLPFRDDIRLGIEDAVLPYAVAPPPSEEAARAAAALVDGVKLADFASGGVTNPKLQHFYTKLEEFAIDADDIVMDSIAPEAPHEVTIDGTLPDVGAFNAAALEAFSAALGGLDPGAPGAAAPKGGTKRKAAEMDPEAQQKADEATARVQSLAGQGKLVDATVEQLKMYCRTHSLTVGGKKGDLMARVEKHVNGE